VPVMITDRSLIRWLDPFTQVGDNLTSSVLGPRILGETILVTARYGNRKVERRQYRFSIVNGSNDRFYK